LAILKVLNFGGGWMLYNSRSYRGTVAGCQNKHSDNN
jgi:hypothetical protein